MVIIRLLMSCAVAIGGMVIPAIANGQTRAPADIAAFCRSVGTEDEPSGAFDYPLWLQTAMGVAGDDSASTVWRCMGGQIYACVGYDSAACIKPDQSRTPSAAMVQYCRENRSASTIPRAGGGLGVSLLPWRCAGGRPSIIRGTSRPSEQLDGRGYLRSDWRSVEQPVLRTGYDQPVTPRGRVHGFFDPAYRQSENRQHLGTDLPSPAGTRVVSPIDGEIVFNRTAGVAASCLLYTSPSPRD